MSSIHRAISKHQIYLLVCLFSHTVSDLCVPESSTRPVCSTLYGSVYSSIIYEVCVFYTLSSLCSTIIYEACCSILYGSVSSRIVYEACVFYTLFSLCVLYSIQSVCCTVEYEKLVKPGSDGTHL